MTKVTSSPPASNPGWGLRAAALLGTLAVLLAVLLTLVRPWYTSWGASAGERNAPLPGNLHGAIPSETRAIDVAASAEHVFAWVAQLGQDRAGFYSFELLEDLAGCEMPNLRHLDPSLQHWSEGDKLWMYPPGELGGVGHATLLYHEPGSALVFGTRAPGAAWDSRPTGTWSFIVKPTGASSSRLLVRAGGTSAPGLLGVAFNRTVFEPLHFAMERRMLEGIAGLAEGRPIAAWRDHVTVGCWAVSLFAFAASAALVLAGRQWPRRLLAFAAAGAVFQFLTLVQPAPFVSLGLALLLLALVWPPRLGSWRASAEHLDPPPEAASASSE